MGNTTTRKRIILAPQGTGKSTIGVAMDKIFTYFDSPGDKSTMPRLAGTRLYNGSDSFSFSTQHKQMEDHRVRSFIVNEAGAAGSSKAGDIGTLKAYQLDVLSRKATSSYEPKQYSSAGKGRIEMKTVFGCVWVYFHESTVDSYISLLNNTNAFANGDLSRSDLIFPNPEIDIGDINMDHSNVMPSDSVGMMLKKMIIDFRETKTTEGKNPKSIKAWKSVDYLKIEDAIKELELEIIKEKNEAIAHDDEKRLSLLVRKFEKIMCTVLLCAIADQASANDDPDEKMGVPVAKIEHLQYALDRQRAIDETIIFHVNGGVFSDKLDSIINEIVIKIQQGGYKATKFKCHWNNDLNGYVVPKSYIRDLLNVTGTLHNYVDGVHRGDRAKATTTVIHDMLDADVLFRIKDDYKKFLVNNHVVSKVMCEDPEFFKSKKVGRPRKKK